MKSPSHPGALLRNDLEALGVTVATASKALGVTRQQLYRVIEEKSAISPKMALRLEKALGGSADFWLRMQAAYDLAQARKSKIKVSRIAAHNDEGAFMSA